MSKFFTNVILSNQYALSRPTYPQNLLQQLLKRCGQNSNPGKPFDLVVDVACGTGQLTKLLSPFCEKILAVDRSTTQISTANGHKQDSEKNIEYLVADCDHLPVANSSVDLICVAQGAHWFPFEAFNKEVCRCLRSGGSLALIGYSYCQIKTEDSSVQTKLDDLMFDYLFGEDYLGPYWDSRRRHVEEHYSSIPLPYPISEKFDTVMELSYPVDLFKEYLKTFSSYTTYCQEHPSNVSIVDDFLKRILTTMNLPIDDSSVILHIQWPVFLITSKKSLIGE